MANNKRAAARQKGREYLAQARSDGSFDRKEISSAQRIGLSMDEILNTAASEGTRIDSKAQRVYGIKQGSNLNDIRWSHGSATPFRAPIKGQYISIGSGKPQAQRHGLYSGVNKDGQHVYRYVGQAKPAAQPANPTPPPQSQSSYQPERPADSPAFGKSWADYISGGSESQAAASTTEQTQSSATSRPANTSTSYRPDADPNNPDLYGAIAGQDYRERFGRFIDYADSAARTQAWEVGNAGRQALSRLEAAPPKLIDPLSPDNVKAFNKFYRKLRIG